MKHLADLSASQMFAVNAAGALLMASCFLILKHIPLHNIGHGPTFWRNTILGIAPFAIGAALSIYAHRQLEDGMAANRWPAQEIASLRGSFETILWRGLTFALVISSGIRMFAAAHHRDLGWFFLILGQGLMRLNYAFRIPPSQTQPPNNWHNASPLRSSHWGQ